MGARVTTAKAVVVLLVCVGLWVARPFAAQDGAALSGTVTDAQGGVLPGATVTVTGPRPPERTAVTNEKGVFHVLGLQSGTYTVRTEMEGFRREQTTVTIVSGHTTTIAVVLHVAGMEETVTVSSSAPAIQTSTSSRAYAVTGPQRARAAHGRPVERSAGGFEREAYRHLPETGFHRVTAQPRSTLSTDVDTASYTNVRRMLAEGRLPPEGAVRIEEFVNYFRFDYAPPAGDAPVAISTEVGPCPWNEDHLLALVGVRAADVRNRAGDRESHGVRGRNLVFLVDVSGSMSSDDKLPLVRKSLHLLTRSPRRRGSHRDGRLRGPQRPRPAADVGPGQGGDPRRHRSPRIRRQHQRRGRHPAGVSPRPGAVRRGRRQPGHPGHRRRLQRRRDQRGSARAPDRAGARRAASS